MTQQDARDHTARRAAAALTVGAVITVWEALPEYVESRGRRAALRTLLLGAAVPALVALTPGHRLSLDGGREDGDQTPMDAHHQLAGRASALADPKLAGAATVGVAAAAVAMNAAERRGKDRLVRALASRGYAHPRTRLAAGFGVLAAVTTYLDPPQPLRR